MPISYTFVNGNFVLISVRHNRKVGIVIFNERFQTGSPNDVREILTVFSLRI